MVITMAKLHMAHASRLGQQAQPWLHLHATQVLDRLCRNQEYHEAEQAIPQLDGGPVFDNFALQMLYLREIL